MYFFRASIASYYKIWTSFFNTWRRLAPHTLCYYLILWFELMRFLLSKPIILLEQRRLMGPGYRVPRVQDLPAFVNIFETIFLSQPNLINVPDLPTLINGFETMLRCTYRQLCGHMDIHFPFLHFNNFHFIGHFPFLTYFSL